MRGLLFYLLIAILVTGCATVDRGTVDHVRVDTVPQGAKVLVITDDRVQGRNPRRDLRYEFPVKTVSCDATPCALEINRNDYALVRVTADGFEPAEYMVGPSSLRGGISLNIAKTAATSGGAGAYIGYGIGSLADAFTLGSLNGSGSVVGATAAGFGLVFSGIAIATDVGTAANKNLFPNPVVLGLTPSGTQTPEDPLIDAFKGMLKTQNAEGRICKQSRKDRSLRRDCERARIETRRANDTFTDLRREWENALREAFQSQAEESTNGGDHEAE